LTTLDQNEPKNTVNSQQFKYRRCGNRRYCTEVLSLALSVSAKAARIGLRSTASTSRQSLNRFRISASLTGSLRIELSFDSVGSAATIYAGSENSAIACLAMIASAHVPISVKPDFDFSSKNFEPLL
jgi:hypothetical protein